MIEATRNHNFIQNGSLESLEDQPTTMRRTMRQNSSRNFPAEDSLATHSLINDKKNLLTISPSITGQPTSFRNNDNSPTNRLPTLRQSQKNFRILNEIITCLKLLRKKMCPTHIQSKNFERLHVDFSSSPTSS